MIVLASRSPRRSELLALLRIDHTVEPAEIDERPYDGESPGHAAERLALAKARAVARRRPGCAVIGADTIVVREGVMLGKPASTADAEAMLRGLAGRRHQVVTAVALVRGADEWARTDATHVWIRPMSDELIRAYVETGEPMDKAGSYGLQGFGAVLVERIEGDAFGVIGLPVRLLFDLLEAAGTPYRFTR
ncbi:MAG TPA: nucleoside triphosphate pyrophosphatase [Gemmatimonadales bacterium]